MKKRRKKTTNEYEESASYFKQVRLLIPVACALGIIAFGAAAEFRKEKIFTEVYDISMHGEHPPVPGNWYIYIGAILFIGSMIYYFHNKG